MSNTTIDTQFFPDRARYHYDTRLLSQGWAMWDTKHDAWYFGVWVHTENMQILTYAEGDESLVTCSTPEAFQAQLAEMREFYGDPPPECTVWEPGQITRCFTPRPGDPKE